MNIQDIYDSNELRLQKCLKVQKMLQKLPKNEEVWKCGNGYIFYEAISNLTAQSKAPLGEKFICEQLNFKRIPASKNCGDAIDNNGNIYEFKNSFTNKGNNLNIRQIRLWQPIDYYYCIYIDEEDINNSLFFVLTKEQMINEVALCGGYTHGTVEANRNNQNKEYSITISLIGNNEKLKRWKENYLSNELKIKILGGNEDEFR